MPSTPAYGDFDRPRLAELAAKQHGVVATSQLVALGHGPNVIGRMAAKGLLHRRYRGVYAVGHARLTPRGQCMAAVLACGPRAVLSHRGAVALWDLRPWPSGPIDVTAPGRVRRGRAGIRLHSVRSLAAAHTTILDGIPVTSLPRALLDYGEVAPAQQLRMALRPRSGWTCSTGRH